jgi:hypothetical protein
MTTALPLARMASQIVVSTCSSPPGFSPNEISSRTAQAIQRSSVTRPMAAKPMPVVRQHTSRMVGTASMLEISATSSCSDRPLSEFSLIPEVRLADGLGVMGGLAGRRAR